MRSPLRRLFSATLALTALALVAFHAAIFWQRIVDATITQPGVLGRWIAAAILLAGMAFFVRKIRGRRATVTFWVLVALLHFSIPGEERVLDLDAYLATLVQVGISGLPVILLAVLLVATARSANRDHSLLFRHAVHYRNSEIASPRTSRAPPRG